MEAQFKIAEFFKKSLIPAAQVLEVLLANTAHKQRQHVGSQFMEPLNLVSAYVLSTGIIPDVLDECITTILDSVLECLGPVNKAPVRQEDRQRFEVCLKDLAFVVEPAIKGMFKAIDYAPAQRSFWLARHRPRLAAMGLSSQKKWRTFARNMNFRRNMDDLHISIAAAYVHRLGSRTGEERLESLWLSIFGVPLTGDSPKVQVVSHPAVVDVPAPVTAAPTLASPVRTEKREVASLPNDVTIELDAYRRIKVKAWFSPRGHLKVVAGAPSPKLSPSLESELNTRYWEELCDAASFANTVANAMNWVAVQKETMAALQAEYDAAAEEVQMQALKNRLRENFDSHEMSLLKKLFSAQS